MEHYGLWTNKLSERKGNNMKTKLLLYCTKAKPNLWKRHLGFCAEELPYDIDDIYCNGKIVAECECEVEKNANDDVDNVPRKPFLEESCLTFEQLDKYVWLCGGEPFYALQLNNIKVFEKPLELRECEYAYEIDQFENMRCDSCMSSCKCESCYYHYNMRELTKAPQNMMQVWYNGQKYVLISIRPEWICKILMVRKPLKLEEKY